MSITASTHRDVDNLQRELDQANKALYRVRRCMSAVRDEIDVVYAVKEAIANDDLEAAQGAWDDLEYQAQDALILAPKSGGVFTTKEREEITKFWRQEGI